MDQSESWTDSRLEINRPVLDPEATLAMGACAIDTINTLSEQTPSNSWEEYAIACNVKIPDTAESLAALAEEIDNLSIDYVKAPTPANRDRIEQLQAAYLAGYKNLYPFTPRDDLPVGPDPNDDELLFRKAA